MVAVTKSTLEGDIGNSHITVTQQMTGLQQPHTVQVALRRAAGLLLHLPVQGTQRQGEAISQFIPDNLITVMLTQPVEQTMQPRLLILTLSINARLTQQHQQL